MQNNIELIDLLYVGCYVNDGDSKKGDKVDHYLFIDPKRVLLINEDDTLKDCNTGEEVDVELHKFSYTDYNEKGGKHISYLMTFKEFAEKLLETKIDKIDMGQAKMIVGFYNRTASKKFLLSKDEELAEEQVKKYVYKKRLD